MAEVRASARRHPSPDIFEERLEPARARLAELHEQRADRRERATARAAARDAANRKLKSRAARGRADAAALTDGLWPDEAAPRLDVLTTVQAERRMAWEANAREGGDRERRKELMREL